MPVRRFEDLEVWKLAHRLALQVYQVTDTFPTKEQFGLTSQMRRSAVSIPANIAEGFGRSGKGEKLQFYNIAQGSLSEVRYYFLLAKDLLYLTEIQAPLETCDSIGRMLHAMMTRTRER